MSLNLFIITIKFNAKVARNADLLLSLQEDLTIVEILGIY